MSASTRAIYLRRLQEFQAFCSSRRLLEFSLSSVTSYIAFLQLGGFTHSTILSHVSALKFYCKINGVDNALEDIVVKSTLRGVANIEASSGKACLEQRGGCTVAQLKELVRMASGTMDRYEGNLVAAMFTVAFFGFLRVSEYSRTASAHSIQFAGCKRDGDGFVIWVSSSKTSRRPEQLRLSAYGDSDICPVRCLSRYLMMRPGSTESQLFVDSAGSAVSSYFVASRLRTLCAAAGLTGLTSHSFRIGGASWAAGQGWSDAAIRAHGRWSSDAFMQYVRPVIVGVYSRANTGGASI